MSRAQDDFCPACRLGLCAHCFLASREWDNPDACLCDCEQAIQARDRLRNTDLAKLFGAMNRGSIGEIVDILFPGRGY